MFLGCESREMPRQSEEGMLPLYTALGRRFLDPVSNPGVPTSKDNPFPVKGNALCHALWNSWPHDLSESKNRTCLSEGTGGRWKEDASHLQRNRASASRWEARTFTVTNRSWPRLAQTESKPAPPTTAPCRPHAPPSDRAASGHCQSWNTG